MALAPRDRYRLLARRRALAGLGVLALLGSCASLPRDVARVPSHALDDFATTRLGQQVAAMQPNPDASGFRLLPSGDAAYDARVALVDQAQRSLDLQYYLIENDPPIRELFAHIRRAAERGIRVRLLLDDLRTASHDAALARFAARPNVQVRLFNPFPAGRSSSVSRFLLAAGDLSRLSRRMHNKLFVADNAVAIAGGRNLGAAYFQRTDDVNFADLDVLVAGPVVRDLSRSFDRYWNSRLAYPIAALAEPPAPGAAEGRVPTDAELAAPGSPPRRSPADLQLVWRLVWAPARVLVDRPSKVDGASRPGDPPVILDDVLAIVRGATRSVVIVSPYFIPTAEVTDALRELRSRGVVVRVLTNSLATTDVPAAHAAYARHRPELLALGVELHELRATPSRRSAFLGSSKSSRSSLHAKAILVDGHVLFVGSMNLDPRSAVENTEVGLLIDSADLGAQISRLFAQGVRPEDSYAVRLGTDGRTIEWITGDASGERRDSHDPEAGFWRSLTNVFLGMTIPEGLL
jgi:phosphatidylserine/phosphatidylglycerophosphate/cardiolipin synthase-like enzyme